MKTILVFGATGNVGFGVAQAALAKGYRVVAPTRSETRAGLLAQELPGIEAVVGDVGDGEEADRLGQRIGQVDHVVASLGGWWQKGPFVEQSAAEYEAVRRMLFDGQVHAARVFLARMQGGSYTLVTGVGALQPLRGTSLLTITLGGTLALSRVLRSEQPNGVRINELRIAARIERTPRPGVVTSADFGLAFMQLLESDVRGNVVPFHTPETFDPSLTI